MFKTTVSGFKRLIHGRIIAYNKVFDRDNQFTKIVLSDLAKFCRAHDSTFHKDGRIHAGLEGRREVWLRIQEYLNLSIDEIYALHVVKEINPGEKS